MEDRLLDRWRDGVKNFSENHIVHKVLDAWAQQSKVTEESLKKEMSKIKKLVEDNGLMGQHIKELKDECRRLAGEVFKNRKKFVDLEDKVSAVRVICEEFCNRIGDQELIVAINKELDKQPNN